MHNDVTNGATISRVVDCVVNGGVVLLPTDTVYGLAVHPQRREAIARLFKLKNRPTSRNLPVMIPSVDEIRKLGAVINDPARKLMSSPHFPGPLTLALGMDPDLALEWLTGREEVAVRIPDYDWLLAVLARTGPLLVTSANVHAHVPKESVMAITDCLIAEPDMVVDGGMRSTVPSTLVNCRLEPPVIERVGIVTKMEIEQALR